MRDGSILHCGSFVGEQIACAATFSACRRHIICLNLDADWDLLHNSCGRPNRSWVSWDQCIVGIQCCCYNSREDSDAQRWGACVTGCLRLLPLATLHGFSLPLSCFLLRVETLYSFLPISCLLCWDDATILVGTDSIDGREAILGLGWFGGDNAVLFRLNPDLHEALRGRGFFGITFLRRASWLSQFLLSTGQPGERSVVCDDEHYGWPGAGSCQWLFSACRRLGEFIGIMPFPLGDRDECSALDEERPLVAVDDADVAWHFLTWLQSIFVPACLSYIAIMTAALLRLLCHGLQLRGGACNFDPLIRGTRGVLRGASFAFLITAWMLPIVACMPNGELGAGRIRVTGGNLVDAALEAQMAQFADASSRTVYHNAEMTPDPTFHIHPPDFLEIEEAAEQRIAIRILVFQQTDYYVSLWVSTDATPNDITRRVAAAMLRDDVVFCVHESVPQLPDDVVTVCVSPAWWEKIDRVPIIFSHNCVAGLPFVGVVPRECSLTDIYVAYGSCPPVGMLFYVQNKTQPFPRTGTFTINPGTLIQLRDGVHHRVELPTTAEALQDLYWARDITAHGMPTPPSPGSNMLVISPTSSAILDPPEDVTVVQLHAFACETVDMSLEGTILIQCVQGLDNMTYQGIPYVKAVAVVPKEMIVSGPRRTGVFIDARDLGESVTFHVFSTDVVQVSDVLGTLDFTVPEDVIVKVSGSEGPVDLEGGHRIRQGTLLILWTDAAEDAESQCDEGGEDTSDSDEADPWKRPFYVMAAVHGFQYKTEYVKVSVLPEDTAATLVEALEEDLFGSDTWRYACPVVPQPASLFVMVLVEYAWTRMLDLVPIYIDVIGTEPRGFAAFVGKTCSLSEIIMLFGDEWSEELQVFAAGTDEAMTEDGVYLATEGMLFTVCHGGVQKPEYQSLECKLQSPQLWVPTDSGYHFYSAPLHLDRVVFLGDIVHQPILQLPDIATWFDVKAFVADSLARQKGEIRVTTPAGQIDELMVRGCCLMNVLGVTDEVTARPYGVFVDARHLGMSIAFVQFSTCTLRLEDILDAAKVRRPAGLRCSVTGAVAYTSSSGLVTFGHRSVLTVKVDVERFGECVQSGGQIAAPSAGPSGGADGHGPDEGGGEHEEDLTEAESSARERSRTPRRTAVPDEAQQTATLAVSLADTDDGLQLGWEIDALSGGAQTAGYGDNLRRDDTFGTVIDGFSRADKQGAMLAAVSVLSAGGRGAPKTIGSSVRPVCMSDGRPVATPCRAAAARQQGSGLTICLSDTVGPVTYNLEEVNFDIQSDCQGVFQLRNAWEGFLPVRDLDECGLHPATKAALAVADKDVWGLASAVGWKCCIYTDGSAGRESSGWAATVVWRNAETDKVFLGGCFGAPLYTSPDSEASVGETCHDSRQAEQVALIWSLLWVVQAQDWLVPLQSVEIYFDNISAGFGMAGVMQQPQGTPLSRVARGLGQLAFQLFGDKLMFKAMLVILGMSFPTRWRNTRLVLLFRLGLSFLHRQGDQREC